MKGPSWVLNAESFLAYGYDLPVAAADAVKQLLTAAHEQKKMPPGPGRDLLDDPFGRDPDFQLSQIDLHVQSLQSGVQPRCIVASRLYTADATEAEWIDDDDLDTTGDQNWPCAAAWPEKTDPSRRLID
jgi:hypothetical protein